MELNKYIEHTCLKQDAQEADIIKLAEEAKEHKFLGVCVNPVFVKLAKELQKKPTGKSVFILDEPTTGLHVDDIKKLLAIL